MRKVEAHIASLEGVGFTLKKREVGPIYKVSTSPPCMNM
jgi:hypothetical protein